MIVDAHCHIFPESFAQRRAELAIQDATFAALFSNPKSCLATTAELIQAMDRDGVDLSVAMGMGWTSQDIAGEVNDFLIQARQEHPNRLVGFCSVNPTWGSQAAREIRRCVEAGLRGVGELHPDTQGFDITSKTLMKPVMMAAYELGVPVVIHASEPVGHSYAGKGSTTPEKLYRFILNFPENDIICAHWGGGLPFYGLMPEVNKALRNVSFDTAVSPLLYQKKVFAAVASLVGPEKILLGSDYPLVPHCRLAQELHDSGLEPEAKKAILGENAARLLKLRHPYEYYNMSSQPEFTDPESTDSEVLETLPDYLQPGLDIVFIGLNPSSISVREGHYFANPRNRFWTALNSSGLVPVQLSPALDKQLLDHGIGLTDLIKRPTSQASGLKSSDYRDGAPILKAKLLDHRPAIACFHGMMCYRAYLKYAEGLPGGLKEKPNLGLQPHPIGQIRVFVVPNPSPANAQYSLAALVDWYQQLGKLRFDSVRPGSAS